MPLWQCTEIFRQETAHRVLFYLAGLLVLIGMFFSLTACGEGDEEIDNSPIEEPAAEITETDTAPVDEEPPAASGIWQPSPGTTWQWQLRGEIDTSYDVEMYDIDLFDAPQSVIDELQAQGRIVICYFSAGSWENWRDDADQFPEDVLGKTLQGWSDEKWLDIRQIDLLEPVMTSRLDYAVQRGCDGVEPDNVDGYANNSGFSLTYDDQIAYNIWLANAAHERGLSVGLKNDLDQVADLEPYFDWALNEECFAYDECDLLLPFIEAGKAVFGVEYNGDRAEYCTQAIAMNLSWLEKTLDLDAEPPGACQ